MRKLFFVLAALPLALTGCLKSDGYTSKLEPVARGLEIYNFVGMQNQISMQPAEIGMRLAMLLAEAKKQNSMDDLENVRVDDARVINNLFGSGTKVERIDDGYKITYVYSRGGINDDYERYGVFYVETNGAAQLAETEAVGSKKWIVTVDDDVALQQSSWQTTINISGGSTVLYNAGNGKYKIDISGLEAWYATSRELKSNWTGSFEWKPGDPELIYSQCLKKESELEGEASGESFYSLNNSTPTHMWYKLTEGRMLSYRRLVGGIEDGGFSSTADYDTARYPSGTTRVEWKYDEVNGLSYVFTWNNISISMP